MATNKTKIENKTTQWRSNGRYRVNDSVLHNGKSWINVNGKNVEPGTNANVWIESALNYFPDGGNKADNAQTLRDDVDYVSNAEKITLDFGEIGDADIDEEFNDEALAEAIEKRPTGTLKIIATSNGKPLEYIFIGDAKTYNGTTVLAEQSDFLSQNISNIEIESSSVDVFSEEKLLTFELNSDSYTSAGIFDGETLIKTLWSFEFFPKGTNTRKIELKDEFSNSLQDKKYQVKILSGLLKPEWLGVIGNTSDLQNYPEEKLYGLEQPKWFHAEGDRIYYSVGYNEGDASVKYFNLSEISDGLVRRKHDTYDFPLFAYGICTDADNMYLAGYATYGSNTGTMIFAVSKTDWESLEFSAGTERSYSLGGTHDVMEGDEYSTSGASGLNPIEGITVQQTGNYVFGSRPSNNTIVVNHKTTGELIRTISTITAPKWVWLESDNIMWLIHDTNVIEKYTVNGDGSLTTTGVTITSTTNPIYLRTKNSKLLVTDAGDNRIKEFNTSDGSATSVFVGREETYAENATVYDDKFIFNQGSAVYDQDNKIWVADDENRRWSRFTSAGVYDNVFGMQLPRTYNVEVDENDKSKIWSDGLVFEISDYSAPTINWKLIRNYNEKFNLDQYFGIRTPLTINGKTFGLVRESNTTRLYDLDPVNTVYTGVSNIERVSALDSNLNIITAKGVDDTEAYISIRSGFDGNGFPVYTAEQLFASLSSLKSIDPTNSGTWQGKLPFRETSDGKIWFYNSTREYGYKVGAVKKEIGAEFQVRTLPATFEEYIGDYETLINYFDTGNGTNYPGGSLYTVKRLVLVNHKGEFWKNAQTNILFLYDQTGLLIHQFGVVRGDLPYSQQMAGNVFCTRGHEINGDLFWFQNDEGHNGGIGIWKVPDVDSYEINTIELNPTINAQKVFISSYPSKSLDPLKRDRELLISDGFNIDFSTVLPANYDANSLSFILEKFRVKLDYEEDYVFHFTTNCGIRVVKNSNIILLDEYENDATNTFSVNIPREISGVNYGSAQPVYGEIELSIELSGQKATTLLCEYESASETRKQIPSEKIKSFKPVFDYTKINLLERLKRLDFIEDRYGWELNPKGEDQTSLFLRSGLTSINSEDIFFHYRKISGISIAEATKFIGKKANTSWEIDMNFVINSVTGDLSTYDELKFVFEDKNKNSIIEIRKNFNPRQIEINDFLFPEVNPSTTKFTALNFVVSKAGIRVIGINGLTYGYDNLDEYLPIANLNANWSDLYQLRIEANIFNTEQGLKYDKRVQLKKAIININ